MKPVLIAGSSIVTLALIFYSIAFFAFHKKRSFNNKILFFQTSGLFFDITATILMITGSSSGLFTFHGLLGYSSLTLMVLDTIFFWNKRKSEPPVWLIYFSRVAYFWWIAAYITGSLLVMLR